MELYVLFVVVSYDIYYKRHFHIIRVLYTQSKMDAVAYALLIVCRYIGIKYIEHLLKSAYYESLVGYLFIQYACTTFVKKNRKNCHWEILVTT